MYDSNIFSQLPIAKAIDSLSQPGQNFRLAEAFVKNADSNVEVQSFVTKLRQLIGRNTAPFSTKIGTHPDYEYLKRGQDTKGPITSIFIDIKGSTQLWEKFPYETAFFMQNAIVQSAIYVIQAFDGHVVRIHGDGIFAVFGRKTASSENCLLDALNASSTTLFFLETYLTEKFKNLGLSPLKIRVGVDHDKDAYWKHNGIDGCNELSPSGLYVSLAAKLQSRASANSIMIGDNVKSNLQLPEEFLTVKTFIENGKEKTDPYIRGTYRMWLFDWENHMGKFSWVTRENGKLLPATTGSNMFHLHSQVVSSFGQLQRVFPSSMEVINKGETIRFSLGPLPKNCAIRWYVENRGDEATEAKCLYYEVPESKNKTWVERDTAYWGHHYLICKVTFPSGKIAERRIGVFVGPNWAEPKQLPTTAPQKQYIPEPNRGLIPQMAY
ncbi:MAG: adenylate/guanylate cyclase domain-containing protein [Bdellovibrionales bacterium]|nr:adenylate/guanylate cyclase domain-containing protein [Bdellovibrionales bacterium]